MGLDRQEVASQVTPGSPQGDRWFDLARRVLVFVLGVAVIIEGLFSPHDSTAELIIGSIMVGVLPLDTMLSALGRVRVSIPQQPPPAAPQPVPPPQP